MFRHLSFTLASVLLASIASSAPSTWYVDITGTPPGSGTPLDPYTSIQHAIAQPTTVAGDTVLVAAGTYFENVDFLGKAIEVRATAGAVIDASNVGSVVSFKSGEGADSILDGFTLRHGRGTIGPSWPETLGFGGGVYCVNASPTLKNLVVELNIAQRGSGMYFSGSAAVIDSCVVRRNGGPTYTEWPDGTGIWSNGPIQVTGSVIREHGWYQQQANLGGGVYGSGSYTSCTIEGNLGYFGGGAYATANLTFVDCTFQGNVAGGEGVSRSGGGIFSGSGPSAVTATECTFIGNVAGEGGGAYGATLVRCALRNNVVGGTSSSPFPSGGGAAASTLIECDVSGNVAGYDSPTVGDHPGFGAGLSGGTATRCTISNNTTYSGGFGGQGGAGAFGATLVDCDVHDNTVFELLPTGPTSRGGGILQGSATRCRIWNNSAPFGAGACDATLTSCTLSGNTATVSGGGVAAYSLPTTLRSSISWNNAGGEIAVLGGSMSVTYSDVQGGFAGTGNIDQNPLFANAPAADFHLLAGSPCINAGDPSLPLDADGSRADMGALPFTCFVGTRCVGKTNSQGCTPAIGWNGTMSLSGTDDFVVTGSGFVNQKSGMLFWGRMPQSVPFQGGTLCVATPLVRTPIQNSGGNPLPPPDCSGAYAFAFTHAYMGANAMLAYQSIHAQWYARDPAQLDGTGVSLSNAIEFTICP